VLDDLTHPILRPEPAGRAPAPRLTTGLTLALFAKQLLRPLARASARRRWRVFGGSDDGGLELARESSRARSSSRLSRSPSPSTCNARSRMNRTHASRPAS
jgi:hypothetical protein